jgi:MFS family permease
MEVSSTRLTLALAGLCTASFLVILDSSVVSLLLPPIARDLHVGLGEVAWVPNAYVLTQVMLIAAAGVLGDRLGRRAVFLSGAVLFVLGSTISAFAGSIGWLIAGRALQGAGSAALLTMAAAAIVSVFRERRQSAFAAYVLVGNLGGALGPVLGGALAIVGTWRAVFVSQIPVGLALVALVAATLPESRGPRRGLDLTGAALLGAAVLAGNLLLLDGDRLALTRVQVIALLGVAVVSLGAFLLFERGSREPMLRLAAFGHPEFVVGTLAATTVWFANLSTGVYVAIYLQSARGMTVLGSGLVLLSWGVSGALTATVIAHVVRRFGQRRVLGVASLAVGAVLVPWAFATPAWPLWLPSLLLAAFGVSSTCALAVSLPLALGAIPAGEAGVGAGMFNTIRQIGSSLGIAVPGAVLAARHGGNLVAGAGLDDALATVFAVRAAIVLAGVLAAAGLLWRLRRLWTGPGVTAAAEQRQAR